MDLDQAFREATGISLNQYLSVGIGIMAHFISHRTDDGIPQDLDFLTFRPAQHFALAEVPTEVWERVLGMISMTLSELKKQTQQHDKRGLAFDFLSMKARPLLQLGPDAFIPVSLWYLLERQTTGIYWIVFDHLKKTYGPHNLHLQFSRYHGVIFQEYVQDLVGQLCTRESGQPERLLFDQTYRKGGRRRGDELRTPDVMIFGDDYAVLIEASATRLTAAGTVIRGIAAEIEKDFDKIVFQNARSLDKFIGHLRSGEAILEGVQPKAIKTYYPVIATLDEGFPRLPHFEAYIESEIKKRGLLSGDDTAPLSRLDIRDLESLEMYSDQCLVVALRSWHSDARFPHISFHDHLASLPVQRDQTSSDWFETVMDQTLNEATMLLLGRRFPESVDPPEISAVGAD